MRYIILPALLLTLATLSSCAQEPDLDHFYDKFKSSDALSGELSISPSLWLSANFSGKDDWKDKISMVRLLILDSKKAPEVVGAVEDLSRALHKDGFDDLFLVRKGKDNIQVLEKDLQEGKRELVLLLQGEDGNIVFVQLKGKLTNKDLEQIQGSLNSDHH